MLYFLIAGLSRMSTTSSSSHAQRHRKPKSKVMQIETN